MRRFLPDEYPDLAMDQTCIFLADQIQRAFEGDAWHGPSLRELLADISPMQAAAHPVTGSHSIWEIVLHINAWVELALDAMQGSPMPQPLQEERDWAKPVDIGPQAWNKTTRLLLETQAKLCRAIEGWTAGQLLAIVPGREYNFEFLLHGIAQHSLYHAGQIALLKKAARSA